MRPCGVLTSGTAFTRGEAWFGGLGSESGQFIEPDAIAERNLGPTPAVTLDASGDLFVDEVHREQHRILECDPNGATFAGIDGLAFSARTGKLYVVRDDWGLANIQKRYPKLAIQWLWCRRLMCRATRTFALVCAVALMAVTLTACGGASSGDVVARVGTTTITKAQVSHWMATLAGGDYNEVSRGHTVPAGLVSEPPHYAACVAHLEEAAHAGGAGNAPDSSQLLTKCRQLHQALKLQAVSFLVEAQWLIDLAREQGLTASDTEVKRLFQKVKSDPQPQGITFEQFLANSRRTLADEIFIVKLDVLRQKTSKKVNEGGKQALAQMTEAGQRWTEKTMCSASYVVQHCKQYTGQPSPSMPSPAVLLEQVSVIAGEPCVNRPACTSN